MKLLLYISTVCVLLSCNEGKTSIRDDSADSCVCVAEQLVERIDTKGLVVLYPHYGSIDLVCDSMPSKKDDRAKRLLDLLTNTDSGCYDSNEISAGTPKDSIHSFLGKPIVINNLIYEQIADVAKQDEMLSYRDSILQIGNVKWRINITPRGVALMTSVHPNDASMKIVTKYLNGIYGEPYDREDDFSIKWSSSDDSLDRFRPGSTLIHLRGVHSEEDGMFLLFN